ncbi:hypothetical protein [Rhizobium herbae]
MDIDDRVAELTSTGFGKRDVASGENAQHRSPGAEPQDIPAGDSGCHAGPIAVHICPLLPPSLCVQQLNNNPRMN